MLHKFALNVELPLGQDGNVPEWVELLPAGRDLVGRDGRAWVNDDPEGVAREFAGNGADLVIDWEHATEHRAPNGLDAPAAAWIKELAVRDGAVWGRVEWTPRAAEQVANREYRYLSPVFAYTKQGLQVRRLCSAALTNTPNLRLTALNRRADNEEDEAMLKALCKLLGLAETASEEQVVQAVTALQDTAKATNKPQPGALPKALCQVLGINDDATAEQAEAKVKELADQAKAANRPEPLPDLNKFVPRADYDAVAAKAANAEATIKKSEEEALGKAINSAVDEAIKGGKIAPASREFYVATCRQQGGLDRFNEFTKTAPQLINDPVLPKTPPNGGGEAGLSEEQLAMCRVFDIDPKDFAKEVA